MPTPDITIKRGDTGKILSGQFLDANGVPVVCTGFTSAKLFMKKGAVLKINGAAFTFSNAATGSWTYTCLAGDVDTVGTYKLEFEVTAPSFGIQTFPTNAKKPYLSVKIIQDLG